MDLGRQHPCRYRKSGVSARSRRGKHRLSAVHGAWNEMARPAAGDLSFRAARKVLRRLPLSPGGRGRRLWYRVHQPLLKQPIVENERARRDVLAPGFLSLRAGLPTGCRTLPIHSYCTNEPFLPPYARACDSSRVTHTNARAWQSPRVIRSYELTFPLRTVRAFFS